MPGKREYLRSRPMGWHDWLLWRCFWEKVFILIYFYLQMFEGGFIRIKFCLQMFEGDFIRIKFCLQIIDG